MVEDDLLVVSGGRLEISLKVKSLTSFPVEEPEKRERNETRRSVSSWKEKREPTTRLTVSPSSLRQEKTLAASSDP